jgi:hypothetical protein
MKSMTPHDITGLERVKSIKFKARPETNTGKITNSILMLLFAKHPLQELHIPVK